MRTNNKHLVDDYIIFDYCRKYMPEYACGDDKTKSAVQLKLEKCQSDVRQLQSKAETEETSCSSSLEKTYFKQYIRALLRHYSRSVSEN